MLCSPEALLVTALTLPLLPSAALRAEDWSQWRGPSRDGVCRETGLLQTFPAEGLMVRWRVPVGWGFSSPVVAQGRVYLADSELVKPRARERLHCFDETTGKALWTYSYDVAYPDWAFDPTQEIGPVATPIVHDDKVYTLGRLGRLLCVDGHKGEVLWQRNLEKDYQVAFAPGTPSPLIEGDLLILFIGGKPGACVVALHKDTGREVWKALTAKVTDLKNGASIHLTANGDSVLLYTDRGELIRARLSPQGYQEISRVALLEPTFPFAGRKVAWPPPAYANRHVFARNGKELIRASLAMKP